AAPPIGRTALCESSSFARNYPVLLRRKLLQHTEVFVVTVTARNDGLVHKSDTGPRVDYVETYRGGVWINTAFAPLSPRLPVCAWRRASLCPDSRQCR